MSLILELPRIVQAASESASASEQVHLIVDSIQKTMDVDACSLYLADDEGNMILVASHGLGRESVGRAVLPAGKGLIGLAARSRHPLNIMNPEQHPEFLYLEGSGEEAFKSLSAVPLIRSGSAVGVLAVQCVAARLLSSEEEAFLVTMGAQLAHVVRGWAAWRDADRPGTRLVKGIVGAPGIAIGRAHLCRDSDLFSVIEQSSEDPAGEKQRWHELLAQVREDIDRERKMLGATVSGDVASIFDAYLMLLADPALVGGVEKAIAAGKDLPSALKSVIHHFAEVFMHMEDPYLRGRNEDIHHLGNRLYSCWLGGAQGGGPRMPEGPVILVGSQVSVSDIAAIPRPLLGGIVSMRGSTTSHSAILANALGIPAVMGVGESVAVGQHDELIVDADTGRVLLSPAPGVVNEYRQIAAAAEAQRGELALLRDEPAVTTDGSRINLLVNSGLLADLSPGLEAGAEGIGLYRTEIPFLVRDGFPTEDEQVETYRRVIEAYAGKPVCMRILDIGGDKQLPYFPIREENPALGWRGIRFCLDNDSLLMTQVRAMIRAAEGRGPLRILLPMICTTGELLRFHAILEDAMRQLTDEGFAVLRPLTGVMVEVPAAISQLPLWRDYVDFVSIGTNDLSQYLLAVDRGNPRVSAYYDHFNPAVLREVRRTADSARSLGLPLSVCGEMASDPAATVLLLGMGIDTLSMSAARLPSIKWLIRHTDMDTARQLLEEVSALGEAHQVRARLNAYLDEIGFPRRAAPRPEGVG